MTAIEWSDGAPIYRQLKERVVAMMLDGVLKPGDALPSVRQVAAEYQLNPITVSRAYQELADEALVEKRRGLGMYITEGAREKLLRQRTRALPARRMAAGAGAHPAPGPDAGEAVARQRQRQRRCAMNATATANVVTARGLSKGYKNKLALDNTASKSRPAASSA